MSNIKTVDGQATATTAILNIVRYLGLAVFGLFLLVALFAATQDGRAILVVPVIVVFAAFWYASLGWFVDTLRLLAKIEVNTHECR